MSSKDPWEVPQFPAWTKATTVFDFCQSVRMYVSNARIAYHLKINHLQAFDHKTSLANYYPFTLGNLRQLSNGHLSMQHLSWRHLSILAISQLSKLLPIHSWQSKRLLLYFLLLYVRMYVSQTTSKSTTYRPLSKPFVRG